MEYKKYITNKKFKNDPEEAKKYWKEKSKNQIKDFMVKNRMYESKFVANSMLNSINFSIYMIQYGTTYIDNHLMKLLYSWIVELSNEIIKNKEV